MFQKQILNKLDRKRILDYQNDYKKLACTFVSISFLIIFGLVYFGLRTQCPILYFLNQTLTASWIVTSLILDIVPVKLKWSRRKTKYIFSFFDLSGLISCASMTQQRGLGPPPLFFEIDIFLKCIIEFWRAPLFGSL